MKSGQAVLEICEKVNQEKLYKIAVDMLKTWSEAVVSTWAKVYAKVIKNVSNFSEVREEAF